jgi:hypothetical protein
LDADSFPVNATALGAVTLRSPEAAQNRMTNPLARLMYRISMVVLGLLTQGCAKKSSSCSKTEGCNFHAREVNGLDADSFPVNATALGAVTLRSPEAAQKYRISKSVAHANSEPHAYLPTSLEAR